MDKYHVTFDRIIDSPPKKENDEERILRLKRETDYKIRKAKWLAESQERPDVPGRSKLINRNDPPAFIGQTILKEWIADEKSELYYYSDMKFLSGSSGYYLKKSDGTHIQQRTIVS